MKVILWHLKKQSTTIVKYLESKYDFYRANADLHGRGCFIISFQISCNTEKNFTRNVIMSSSKMYPFSYTKSKSKEFYCRCYVVKLFVYFLFFISPSFSMSFWYLLLCVGFLLFFRWLASFWWFFFIFKKNTL